MLANTIPLLLRLYRSPPLVAWSAASLDRKCEQEEGADEDAAARQPQYAIAVAVDVGPCGNRSNDA